MIRIVVAIGLVAISVGTWSATWSVVYGIEASTSEDSESGSMKVIAGGIDSISESADSYQKPSSSALRRKLSRIQFNVTQNEATEPAKRNRYWNNKKSGTYECVVCGQDLFVSDTKFVSGTGWPSFYAPISRKSIGTKTDNHFFYSRTEVHCSRCDAHLGHVFDDGPKPTGLRYCMNSAAMNFIEQKEKAKDDQ